MDLSSAIRDLESEREKIDSAITTLRDLNSNGNGNLTRIDRIASSKAVRRTLSAAARRRIAAAQRKRWRNYKKQQVA